MKTNYYNKTAKPIQISQIGETTAETVFEYQQTGATITSEYADVYIKKVHFITLVEDTGNIEMCHL